MPVFLYIGEFMKYPENSPKIGGEYPDGLMVFQLFIEEYLVYIDPKDFKLKDQKGIDPVYYFITSGDAISKTEILCKDYVNHCKEIFDRIVNFIAMEHKVDDIKAKQMFEDGQKPNKYKDICKYYETMLMYSKNAKILLDDLKSARGENCFFETEWDNHKLFCIAKNPRNR